MTSSEAKENNINVTAASFNILLLGRPTINTALGWMAEMKPARISCRLPEIRDARLNGRNVSSEISYLGLTILQQVSLVALVGDVATFYIGEEEEWHESSDLHGLVASPVTRERSAAQEWKPAIKKLSFSGTNGSKFLLKLSAFLSFYFFFASIIM